MNGLDLKLTLEAIDRTAKTLEAVVARIDKVAESNLKSAAAASKAEQGFQREGAAMGQASANVAAIATRLEAVVLANQRAADSAVKAEGGFLKQAGAFSLTANQALDLVAKLGRLTDRIVSFTQAGVSFNATLEDSKLAIASLLLNFRPDQFNTLDKALSKSADTVDRLVEAAKKSPATFGQLLETLKGVSGAAFAANIDIDRQVKLVVLLSQAMKSLVPPEQLLQESRALLTGNVGNVNAQAAQALGIKAADIEKAKAQGQLYEYLEGKLAAFAVAGERASSNYSTALSNLGDAFEVFRAKASAPVFDALRAGFGQLTAAVNDPALLYQLQAASQNLGAIAAGGVDAAAAMIGLAPQLIAVGKAVVGIVTAMAVGRGSFLLLSGDLWAGISRGIGGVMANLRTIPSAVSGMAAAFGTLRDAPLTMANIRGAIGLARQEAQVAAGAFAAMGAALASVGALAAMAALNAQMERLGEQQRALGIIQGQGAGAVNELARAKSVSSESDRAERVKAVEGQIADLKRLREGMTAELGAWDTIKKLAADNSIVARVFGIQPKVEANRGDAAAMEAADVALRRLEEARRRLAVAPVTAVAGPQKPLAPETLANLQLEALAIEKAQNEAAMARETFLLQNKLQGFEEFSAARRVLIQRDYDLEVEAARLKAEQIANLQEREATLKTDTGLAEARRQKAVVQLELDGVREQMERNREAQEAETRAEEADSQARLEIAKATGDERQQIALEVAQVISRLRKEGLSEERLAAIQTILTNQRIAESIRRKTEAEREFVLAQTRAVIKRTESDPGLSNYERESRLLEFRKAYVVQLERAALVERQAMADAATSDDRKIEARERLLQLEGEIQETGGQIQQSGRPTAFTKTRDFASQGFGYDEEGNRRLVEPYEELDAFIAGTLQQSFDGISESIAGWVNGTATWGEVWLGVKNSIVEGFVQMLLEYTLFHWARMALDRIFYSQKQIQDSTTHNVLRANIIGTAATGAAATTATAATTAASAGSVAAASAPAAASTSIWSFGSAAGIGLALALAAIIGITAALAFNEGGVVPGARTGRDTVPAMLTPGEVVIPEPVVRAYGSDYFMGRYVDRAGLPPRYVAGVQQLNAGGVAMAEAGGQRSVEIHMWDSRKEAESAARNSDTEALVMDVVTRNRHLLL
jgi:hypothetical protein